MLTDISMYIIRNDGFDLGARRRPLTGQSDCNKFLMEYNLDKNLRNFSAPNSLDVVLDDVIKRDYNLFPFNYMEHLPISSSALSPIGKYIKERKV